MSEQLSEKFYYAQETLTAERWKIWRFLETLKQQFCETQGAGGIDADQAPYRRKLSELDRALRLLGKPD